MLLVGFHPDEISLTELVGSIAAELDLAREIGAALVNRKSSTRPASLLEGDDEEEDDEEDEDEEEEDEEKGDVSNAADGMDDWDDEDLDASFDGYEVHRRLEPRRRRSGDADSLPSLSILPARCVLLRATAPGLMPHLRWEMQSAGFSPPCLEPFTAATQGDNRGRLERRGGSRATLAFVGGPGSPANAKDRRVVRGDAVVKRYGRRTRRGKGRKVVAG